jgi:omega-amidase
MLYKVSIAQINLTLGDYESNYIKAEKMIIESASAQSDLVLLPELWPGGYDYQNLNEYGDATQRILDKINQLSLKYKIAIAGSYLIKKQDHLFNTMIVNHSGESIAQYEKLHLFSPMDENRYFSRGKQPVVFDFSWGKTGLAICYDLRFPELFRLYFSRGVKVLLLSAEWPLERIEHWRTLLRARAIEDQCFVIGCNCVGKTGKEIFGGASAAIDPLGNTIAEADLKTEQLLTIEIDPDQVELAQKYIPIAQDKRDDIYG